MSDQALDVYVNGVRIAASQIDAEVQYHHAPSFAEARYEATRALIVRELLVQKSVSLGICSRVDADKSPDSIIEQLLQQEISVPESDEETCKRYYDNNTQRFYTSPLYEVSHILYLAPPNDDRARQNALQRANAALKQLRDAQISFETMARQESACSSSAQGGRLGQIRNGQTLPAFESAISILKEGEISDVPVATDVGYHIIKMHNRVDGKLMPFESVRDWIADFLRTQCWRKAFNQYVQILVGEAEIKGFFLRKSDSPLVQ